MADAAEILIAPIPATPPRGMIASEYRSQTEILIRQVPGFRKGEDLAADLYASIHGLAITFKPEIIEQTCLATAVYFEARSEPRDGQLAVATVILNRVKAPNFPSSICGVVYQGASREYHCQFSFACDGKPDRPTNRQAWVLAIEATELALTGGDGLEDATLERVSTATHYHADYVKPAWSRSLNRVAKIGHHIFYAKS